MFAVRALGPVASEGDASREIAVQGVHGIGVLSETSGVRSV
jgi:hypothetical protein